MKRGYKRNGSTTLFAEKALAAFRTASAKV